jgi:hypothetical protein
MYVLTNIEATVTHKLLSGPTVDTGLPEPERKTLRDLLAKLSTAINNGLPEDPPVVDAGLPTQPPAAGNELPETPDKPDNALPGKPAGKPDNETPGAKPKG